MSENPAGFLSRLGRGVLGCLPCAIFGLFVHAICASFADPAEARFFPWLGVAIGAVIGFFFAFAFGHLEIRGRTKVVIICMLFGLAIGLAAGYIIGRCWPAFEEKEQTVHIFIAVIFGTPAGAIIGGIVGFLKKDPGSPAAK